MTPLGHHFKAEIRTPPKQGLDLTNPGAAQSVLQPPCLLSELAVQAHVEQALCHAACLHDLMLQGEINVR